MQLRSSARMLFQPMPPAGIGHAEARRQPLALTVAGGLVTGDEWVLEMRDICEQPLSRLARWIAGREIISFTWSGSLLLPLAQFDPRTRLPREGIAALIGELCDACSDVEIADWFAAPNRWLRSKSPAQVIAYDVRAVLLAAHAHLHYEGSELA